VVVEVRPKYLVADTNCFIDCLEYLKIIASTTLPNSTEPCYILNVPIIGKSRHEPCIVYISILQDLFFVCLVVNVKFFYEPFL